MTLSARILGVSVWGPGLEGWAASRPVLAGAAPYAERPSPPPPPAILPPTERRRSGPVVRLALAVAHEAAEASGLPPASLRAVFGSSNGDGPVVAGILDALAGANAERVVSPTQFHNSVHNAAAGYWSIATGSRQPASCVGCHDDTWAAALLLGLTEYAATGEPCLVCCYDYPLPPPLLALRPTGAPFAAALVIGPGGSGPSIQLALQPLPATPPTLADPGLQELAATNPAARSLPLLMALASGRAETQVLPYFEGRLELEIQP